jgi:mycofactocin system FadH/OYE family oxidoreductase 2
MRVPNRILMTAHAKGGYEDHVFGDPMAGGSFYLPTERNAYYYGERAKGGAGLLTTGYQMVHPTSGGAFPGLPHSYRKETIERYRLMADMVHRQGTGTKIIGQICHVGMNAYGNQPDHYHEVWSASAVPGISRHGIPKPMEKEDIRATVEGFAQSAANLKEAGMDGVEVHGAHGYLLHQFMSPLTNRRADEYGGSLENRCRLALEVIEAVRGAVGRDFPLGLRISGDEMAPGGLTLEHMREVARILADTGQLDWLHVSVGAYWSVAPVLAVAPMGTTPGFLVPLAAAIKQVVDIPVFCVGRITDPMLAEKILSENQADMVGMTRALIADPELPNKAREGRLEDIRHCMGCGQACFGNLFRGWVPVGCVQNPAAGREKYLGSGTLTPATTRKRVVIIGGGPAGLKAAEVAARRGHQVTLYEKEPELGGQVRLAARVSTRAEFEEVARYLIIQNRKLGVQMVTGTAATADMVLAENPDAVVTATGCRPTRTYFSTTQVTELALPGFDGDNVFTVWDILGDGDDDRVGQKVVLVDEDGTWRSIGTAEYLADHGKQVTIVTSQPQPASGIEIIDLRPTIGRLARNGVRFLPATEVRGFENGSVITFSPLLQAESRIEDVDSVVVVTGRVANDELYFALKGKVKELYRVGDAVAPRNVEYAIWDGEMVGRRL